MPIYNPPPPGGGGGPATQLDAAGTVLDVDAIDDGEVLKRVGSSIVSEPAGAPGAHVLASTAALGGSHTVAGLTARQVLIATGATTALFRALVEADIPAAFIIDTELADELAFVYDEVDVVDTNARQRLDFIGEWSIGIFYDPHSLVRRFDDLYESNVGTIGVDPTLETDWDLVVRGHPLPLSVNFDTEVYGKEFSKLDDVSATWDADVVSGDFARWDDASNKWLPYSVLAAFDEVIALSTLAGFSDVTYAGLSAGDVLVYTAGFWTPVDPATLVAIADKIRTTTGPTNLAVGAIADGQFLKRVGGTVVGAAPGGAVAIYTAEVDFGANCFREKVFQIADAAVAAAQKIIAWQSGEAPTGRQADENEFATFTVVASDPVAGVGFKAYIRDVRDFCELQGKLKINYLLG